MKEKNKDLNYWKENAKDAYMTTPICVLRYITELEKAVKNNAVLPHVGGSAYRDELLKKTESMEEFAKQNYEHKEYYEGLLNGLRNMRAHIKNTYRKHYR